MSRSEPVIVSDDFCQGVDLPLAAVRQGCQGQVSIQQEDSQGDSLENREELLGLATHEQRRQRHACMSPVVPMLVCAHSTCGTNAALLSVGGCFKAFWFENQLLLTVMRAGSCQADTEAKYSQEPTVATCVASEAHFPPCQCYNVN